MDGGRHAEERRSSSCSHPDGHIEPLAIGVPGDRDVDMKRLEAQVGPAEIEPFSDDDFAANPLLVKGYIGPGGAGRREAGRHAATWSTRGSSTAPSGSPGPNSPAGTSSTSPPGRDFTADGTVEAAEVVDGDPCPACGRPLEIARGIEIGHIFQLGRKYADGARPHRARPERQAAGRDDGLATASACPGRWPRSPR